MTERATDGKPTGQPAPPDSSEQPAPRVPGAAAEDGLWSPSRRALTIGLVLIVTILASEALAVSTIMPIVARDLGGIELYGWVFSGFFLGTLLGIVVTGTLIDRGSLARPFLLGVGLFTVGLVLGGVASSMDVLVGARVVQGLGAGAVPSVAYVAIGRALPERLRPQMFATLSTAWVVPGVLGPGLAGVVAESLHWRLVFLGLLPLVAVAVWLTLPAIRAVAPAPAPAGGEGPAPSAARRRLPLAVALVTGAGLAMAGLSGVSAVPLLLLGAGIAIALPAFARLTPPGTVTAAPGLPTAVLLRGILTFAFFAADVYVPLAIQDWRGEPAIMSGIVFTAATLAWTMGSWVQARRVERIGPGRFLALGFSIVALGTVGFAAILLPAVPLAVGVAAWSVVGFGMGLAYSAPALIVLREAAPGEQGTITAGLQLSDVIGTALGTGVGGALIALGVRSASPLWVALGLTFAIAVGTAVVGLVLTRRLGRRVSRGVSAVAAPAQAG